MPIATAADGVRLHVEEAGAGPPLVLAHELGSDLRQWRGQIEAFRGRFRCIACSARGYPPSEVPAEDAAYGWERSAGDLGAVMDAAGVARAAVLGWSMGAYAALQFARLNPARVSALALVGVGSGSPAAERAGFQAQMRELAALWGRDPAAAALDMAEGPGRQALRRLRPRAFEAWLADLATHSPEGMARTCRNYQGERPSLHDFAADWAKLDIPALIVCGEADAACLETSRWLAATLPRARLWLAEGLGHAPNLEDPARFNREVGAFLEEALGLSAWVPDKSLRDFPG